jgi:hypothetical protein
MDGKALIELEKGRALRRTGVVEAIAYRGG